MQADRKLPCTSTFPTLWLAPVSKASASGNITALNGMTEILPAYSLVESRARMYVVDAVTVYSGDSGDWGPPFLRLTHGVEFVCTGAAVAAGASAVKLDVDSRLLRIVVLPTLLHDPSVGRLNRADIVRI